MAIPNILARMFLTCCAVPHLVLGAELSSDCNECSSVFSFNAMFGFAIGTGVGFFAKASNSLSKLIAECSSTPSSCCPPVPSRVKWLRLSSSGWVWWQDPVRFWGDHTKMHGSWN
jgi:hypothetical protein